MRLNLIFAVVLIVFAAAIPFLPIEAVALGLLAVSLGTLIQAAAWHINRKMKRKG